MTDESGAKDDMDIDPISDTEPEEANDDPHDLQRYTSKQNIYFDEALDEINRGQKRSCWMWYVIPTPPWIVNGVERGSYTNQRYSIRSDEQALAFLKFEANGQNLRNNYLRIMEAILEQVESGRDPVRLIGAVDYPKLISSVKYFNKICKDGVDDEIFKVTEKILPFIPEKSKKKKQSSGWNWFNRTKSEPDKKLDEDDSPFKAGVQVQLKDLRAHERRYNGKIGRIVTKLGLAKSYKVKVGSITLTVRTSNMTISKPQLAKSKTVPIPTKLKSPTRSEEGAKLISTSFRDGDAVRVHMLSREKLHGKQGVIQGEFDKEERRYSVRLDGEGFNRRIFPECLNLVKPTPITTPELANSKQVESEKPQKYFKEGDRVQFRSKLREDLHGKEGEISGRYDPSRSRYPVRFDYDSKTVEYVLPKFLYSAQPVKMNTRDVDSMEIAKDRIKGR